jgi:hypothetical protein
MLEQELTIGACLEEYLHHISHTKKESSAGPIRSVFVRDVVPALGGSEPKGKRSTAHEITCAMRFLNSIPTSRIDELLDAVHSRLLEQSSSTDKQRSTMSRVRGFVDWMTSEKATGQEDLSPQSGDKDVVVKRLSSEVRDNPLETNRTFPNTEEKSLSSHQKAYRFRPLNRRSRAANGSRRTYARDLRLRGKSREKAFSLGCKQFNDFVHENNSIVLANPTFQAQLDAVENYERKILDNEPATINKSSKYLKSFYGWLHRYKGIPLSELAFTQQIPVFQLHHELEDCLDSGGLPSFHIKVIQDAISKDKAKKAALKFIELFKEYLVFMNGAASSECAYIGAMINVAKCLYHDITDREQYDNFQDISFVRQLSLLRRERDRQEEPVVAREKKSLPWPQILAVLEHLRIGADKYYHDRYSKDDPGKIYRGQRRKDLAVAKSLLKFLIVAFLCVIPPDRSRTIQELEVGVTMLQGDMINGEFVPADYLVDQSDLSWWLYLPSSGYKTGKKYGPYWSKLPNVHFADGKRLYEYIDRWLSKDRQLFPLTHNRFFTRHSGKPVTAGSLWEYHRDFFMKIADVPVTPQALRASFVTYLYDIGVPDYELDAVAFSMHHSRRMQESHYRKQKQLKRTQIAVARSVEIVETIIGLRSENVPALPSDSKND